MPKYNIAVKLTNAQARQLASNQSTLMGLIKDASTKRIVNHVPLTVQSKSPVAGQIIGAIVGVGTAILIPVASALLTEAIKHCRKKAVNSIKRSFRKKELDSDHNCAIA